MTNLERLCERFVVSCSITPSGRYCVEIVCGERLVARNDVDVDSACAAVLAQVDDEVTRALRGLEFAATYAHRLAAVERATPRITGAEDEPRGDVAAHSLSLALAIIANGIPENLCFSDALIYALIHDLVEAECGDTDTSTWTPEIEAAKAAKESEGLRRLLAVAPPQIATWVQRYERQEDPVGRLPDGSRLPSVLGPATCRRLGSGTRAVRARRR